LHTERTCALHALHAWLSSRGIKAAASSSASALSSALPAVAAAPIDASPPITTCHRCSGNCHIRTSCPNQHVDGAEARQLASSGTRCTFWYSRSGVYCDGRGHVSRHHRFLQGASPSGKGKGSFPSGKKGDDGRGSKGGGTGKGKFSSPGKGFSGRGKSGGKQDRYVARVGADDYWEDETEGYCADGFDQEEQYPEWSDEDQLELECLPADTPAPVAAVTAPPPGLTAPPDSSDTVVAAAPSEEELRQGFLGGVLCGAITTDDVDSGNASVEELVALLEQNATPVRDSLCVGKFQLHQEDSSDPTVTAAVLQDLQWDADGDGKPCHNRHSTYRAQFSVGTSTIQGHPDPGSAKNFLKENFFEAVRRVHPSQVLDVWGAMQPVFTFSKDKKLIEKACVLRTRIVGDCGRYFELSVV
jgi:hypothetical protein